MDFPLVGRGEGFSELARLERSFSCDALYADYFVTCLDGVDGYLVGAGRTRPDAAGCGRTTIIEQNRSGVELISDTDFPVSSILTGKAEFILSKYDEDIVVKVSPRLGQSEEA